MQVLCRRLKSHGAVEARQKGRVRRDDVRQRRRVRWRVGGGQAARQRHVRVRRRLELRGAVARGRPHARLDEAVRANEPMPPPHPFPAAPFSAESAVTSAFVQGPRPEPAARRRLGQSRVPQGVADERRAACGHHRRAHRDPLHSPSSTAPLPQPLFHSPSSTAHLHSPAFHS